MTPELPPRNWVMDGDECRLANDEEYALYLSAVIGREGLVIVDETTTAVPDSAE